MKNSIKLGKCLKVGDTVRDWMFQPRTITHFTKHPGLDSASARIAHSGDWRMTVFNDDFYEIFIKKQTS